MRTFSAVFLLSSVGFLGCTNSSTEFPKTYVACYEKALLETKHNSALLIAIEHCEKMDPNGAAAYNSKVQKTQSSGSSTKP